MHRYLSNVTSLRFTADRCSGCGTCVTVCPQRVWRLEGREAVVQDRDACMECSACAINCPEDAITVRRGVGCANALILSAFGRQDRGCC